MKHVYTTAACAALLLGSLTACGSADDKSTLPTYTGGSSPSATTTAASPAKTSPSARATGPVALVPHATYTYQGLRVTVDQPADIPKESRSSMMVLSEFLQAVDRTTARNKLDPSVANLASADVVKYVGTFVVPGSVRAIGSTTYTISKVERTSRRSTRATVCVDQSKVVQVRKDGSHFVHPNAKKFPRVKMKTEIFRGMTSPEVTDFTFAAGTC